MTTDETKEYTIEGKYGTGNVEIYIYERSGSLHCGLEITRPRQNVYGREHESGRRGYTRDAVIAKYAAWKAKYGKEDSDSYHKRIIASCQAAERETVDCTRGYIS